MTAVRGVVMGPPNVVVSDGRTVVRSDDAGAFAFDAAGPFVFVCTPSGYTTPTWFLPVDGDLSFALEPQEQSVPFTFVQIADIHLSVDRWVFGLPSISTPEVLAELLDEVAATAGDAAFVVASGDQTNDGTEAEYEAYVRTTAASPLRIRAIAGNHDHNSVDTELAASEGARFGPGVLYTPYDRHIGPRWYSFDHAGVHFVAIDWTTHHLGVERDVQEAWVRSDLAEVDVSTPVIFLTHDLMQTDFFQRAGADPVATVSGHWHTSRVARVGRALHINTAPATFGGLDYAAAHWRTITWDGRAVSTRTVERGSTLRRAKSHALWMANLGSPTHRAGPVAVDDVVVVATANEDTPGGSVVALDAASGVTRWRVDLAAATKATPLVSDGHVVASSVTGETVCVDLASGREIWRTDIDDPLRLWTYLRPATDGRLVFVGDAPRLAALSLEDGTILWSRDDLAQRGNITCHAHPVVVDGVLVIAFSAQMPDMWALDAATGTTRWPLGVDGASLYELGGDAAATHLPRGPVSGFARDPDDADVYVVRLGNVIERLRVADGSSVWTAPIEGWFNPAAPVCGGDDLYVCQGTGAVLCLDRRTGAGRWKTVVTETSSRWMGPYRSSGGCLFGEVALTTDHAIVGCGDGRVVWVARSDGAVVRETATQIPIVTAPAIADGRCFVLGVDGVLVALETDM